MKHLILTVSLITSTYSVQAAEQKFFPNSIECSDAKSAVIVAVGFPYSLVLSDQPIEYKDRMLSFKCHVPYSYGRVEKPYVLIESRQELRDRTNREYDERQANRMAYEKLQQKKADLLIGIQ